MSTELLDRAPTLERRHGLPVHTQIEQWLMDEITHGQIAATACPVSGPWPRRCG